MSARTSGILGDLFHPATAAWFAQAFPAPTAPQLSAWPAIRAGEHALIAAPTGSGKTLAAFLAAIDGLVRQGVAGELLDAVQVVYVSPLKALSNDISRNLETPLQGICEKLRAAGLPEIEIRTWVRTGDTPAAERTRMTKRPPHIIVTTPESLYILLGSESGRKMLATTRSVIVDEIHALAPNKRGSHLSLSLERLEALCGRKLQRIGLSATQKPIEEVARFLVGASGAPCRIVDTGHTRDRDLALEVPSAPLEAVMSGDVWKQTYIRLAALIDVHKTTLIFVNTRRMAERATRALSELVGEAFVTAHHGSLAKEQRFDAEQRLKCGALKALVATASLELGIDIGDVDLVCQIGSPRSISSFLQRIGRSGHAVSGTPKGRLFPLSRDELVECTALLDSVRRGELDHLTIPPRPLDVLAQQIAAEAASRDWDEDDLFRCVCRAHPYRDLPRSDFDEVIRMLAEGFTTRRGRRGALIHHDAVNHVIRGRRGARLTALTSGGAIPDNADYQVLLEPESHVIGSVHEDFAVESLAGDVFQLGNNSYRILRVERGTVRVEDAHGQPPTIPFWLGEAPGRSDALSLSVSRLRGEIETRLRRDAGGDSASRWLIGEVGIDGESVRQIVDYLASARAALGCLPTHDTIVFERFFDEAGGMQLVVHSPFGSRLNRAWGLALRKRFCRRFNVELQAAATEDNIVLSLTAAHSCDLAEVPHYLKSASVRDIVVQALLDAPMFGTRWRWVASAALALPRFRGGRKVPPQIARMESEDLVAAVFPDQVACGENLVGDREIPDHPLVRQTLDDCLTDAMDVAGLEGLLARVEAGTVRIVTCDLTGPSPLAAEVLTARPYAYLDDAPLEERRTQAVMSRRWTSPDDASELGRLDADAIARVRSEAWPDAANEDELHDALVWLGFLTEGEVASVPAWQGFLTKLAVQNRVARLSLGSGDVWITAERLPQFRAVWPDARLRPAIAAPVGYADRDWSREAALVEILRGRLEGLGPVTEMAAAAPLGLPLDEVAIAFASLQAEGFVLRGRFTAANGDEWCERRLLARIHLYTVKRLRAEIEPVAARDFLRFLLAWQRVTPDSRMEGPDAVEAIVGQLEGFEAPAGAWESDILPSRIDGYDPEWLDDQCRAGRVAWARLAPRAPGATRSGKASQRGPVRTTPIALLPRRRIGIWTALSAPLEPVQPSANGKRVLDFISQNGASFFDELIDGTHLLEPQVEDTLAELVASGKVTSDSFAGLRALLIPADRRKPFAGAKRRRRTALFGMAESGRWSLARRNMIQAALPTDDAVEHLALTLLRRYGVVFWRMLERESAFLPPWRELLRVYRRLEARGEIRGGRFVAGFSGEQFALPEAIGALREVRRQPSADLLVSLSGADPLNLVGILTPGPKLAALTGNRVLYRDGIPIACLTGGTVDFLESLEPALQWRVQKMLLRGSASLADSA